MYSESSSAFLDRSRSTFLFLSLNSMTKALSRILLVDDEVENLRALERTLRGKFELMSCETPREALEAIQREDFAVIVSDQRMPGMLGTDLLAKVATTKPLITRIILTAHTDTKEILDAINRAEIYRYITKPWDNAELVVTLQQAAEHYRLLRHNQELIQKLAEKNRRLEDKEKELLTLNQSLEVVVEQRTAELRQVNERLNELAMTDPLTKLQNRRAFFQKFGEEIERSRRYKHSILVAMIDVDHFKTFNDMEGHVFGDEALKKIAQLFTSNLRKTDVLGRYGGEEFILMLPETPLEGGIEKCERLRTLIETTTFQGKKEAAYLTVSFGVAIYPQDADTPEALVKAADQALYQAKEFGRNRVVAASNLEPSFFR